MCINFDLSSAEFKEKYEEKKPLLIKGAANTESFSWGDVNQIFERSDVASSDFKLSLAGIRPKEEYVESYWDIGKLRHRLIKPAVYDLLQKGATLIANKIINEPSVERISRTIALYTKRQVVSSAYLAFGTQDSFRSHWDTRDVFAVQLIGRKRWIVHAPSLEAPYFTQQSKDYENLFPRPEEPYMDFILEPGDVFYLPRGWWHNPLPLGEPTFHLALGTFPAYGMDYLLWALKSMPEIREARLSLSCWKNDQEIIMMLARSLEELISSKQNYDLFMDKFNSDIRVQSPLALEIFGNNGTIPDSARLRLCSQNSHGKEDGYIIANGTKLNLDPKGIRLISKISSKPGITLHELISEGFDTDSNTIKTLVTELCRLDILELLRDGDEKI
ncbi:Ribosomal protein L16 Arg81 hydroxylase, contains JmjC domain [Pseudomonas cuatrocienegasensis]|uniref:Ribosomal protein L16 Arg81 hydroxylase, contains JmjC domain n=1 Tax=Pseudomonas cuatrocienegasensis TaxID=543360 RepID=A0ABY1B5W2_9PSED|nr:MULTISPECIES: cupin domain-containing protein [Pseudomonas]OEC37452.1 cupin [Pseudomonas sp. 21C1]SEP97260.1 Ribosomal protein L16 Arg81 hydroxylase, contains JmjC domain [Pseudomonas cuatrocienegasensis]